MQHASRIASVGTVMGLALAIATAPLVADPVPAYDHLPFDMPARSVLAAKPKKVFAHYFTPFIQKINNNPPATDYYTVNFLDPYGENNKHKDYGGLLRQRPLPRAPLHLSEIDNMGRSDMRYEVRMARAAGFDGFAVDILSYEGQHWERVQKMFDAAADEADDFKILVMPDMNGKFKNNAEKLVQVIQALAQEPAAFRLNDKLVVAPYKAENHTPTWWQDEVLDELGFDVHFWPVFHKWNDVTPPAIVGNTDLFKDMIYGSSEWGSHNPTVSLIDDDADAGPFLELFYDNGTGYCLANKLGSGPATPIPGTNISLGTWYRVQRIVSNVENSSDTYTLQLTRPNGTPPPISSLPFRFQLDDITGVRFIHNGNAAAKGGFLIDNVHVTCE